MITGTKGIPCHVARGIDGRYYLVFDSEYECELAMASSQWCYESVHSFGNFLNAVTFPKRKQ